MTTEAMALLQRLGVGAMAHAGGRSLRDHLVGTAALAETWGFPAYLRLAALFHSVYGTAVYRRAAAGAERREEIHAAIGRDAERIAFAFGALDRARFVAAVKGMAEPAGVTLATRFGDAESYAGREVVDLVLLAFANEIEQVEAGSPAYERVSRGPLGAALLRWGPAHVPAAVLAFLETARSSEPPSASQM
jgi:hypothetical protein